MSLPDFILTETQRYETEQRILNDANLIARGATISAAGVLVLGETQREYLGLSDEFPYFDFLPLLIREAPAPRSPKDEWLDTSVAKALRPDYATASEIPQPLRRWDQTMRDILVLGYDFMAGMHGVGAKSMGAIEKVIARNEFGFNLKRDAPTPEEIAHICSHLGQVTSQALRLGNLSGKRSVLDVLKTPMEERRVLWAAGQWPKRTGMSAQAKDRLFNYPEVFNIRFTRERWIQEQDSKQ